MKIDDMYAVKKLYVTKEKTGNLPLWFNHILTNKMMPKQEQMFDAIDNPKVKGYHFYGPSEKPLSNSIDFTFLKANE